MSPLIRVLPLCLLLGALTPAITSGADGADLQLLKQQMLDLQAAMKAMKEEHQKEIDALTAKVQSQQAVIDNLQQKQSAPPMALTPDAPPPPALPKAADAGTAAAPATAALFPTTDDSVVLTVPPPPATATATATASTIGAGAGAFAVTDSAVVSDSVAAASSGAPITIAASGKSYLNISFNGQFSAASSNGDLGLLEVGDHDPIQTGFNARNLEIAIDGAVDPYFEGFANIVFKLDDGNETAVEAEEAYMQTTSLPWGLQVRGGQFFAPFGRINPQHPHTWDFVDAPLVSGRLMGPDGLRGIGAQIAWVAPLPWYSQFLLGIQNGEGGTGYSFRNLGETGTFMGRTTIDRGLSGIGDLLFVPRWENSFDLSPSQTMLLGVSGAFGPNDTGPDARTTIVAADLFYKWKPATAEGGWPFVKWQTEGIYRHYQAGLGDANSFPLEETFNDWGIYSQVVWGFKKGWDFGLRGDYLHMDDSALDIDPFRQSRSRISTALTWHLTEFSKLRLQYNHDFLEPTPFLPSGDNDSVFLQFEFNLGAHGAHKY